MERDNRLDDVVRRARTGDRGAITALYRAYQPRLLRYLRARDQRSVEDIASETWLEIAQQIERFDGGADAFSAWMFSIARERITAVRKAEVRHPANAVADAAVVDDSAEEAAVDHLSAQAAVALIVRALTPDQAEVLLLRVLGDLSIAQVADVMGRDQNWVAVTQHRAMKRLTARIGSAAGVRS